ncbi:hypothetical protein [Motilimonas sp. E26]|uniref:hypothetical protein n=1 Tax=Motilimonas sp. E26 TaxID=2865674 RepID=UPI001E32F55C|nr:hypothetical protein [Motilimonas sp. E26]MCE0559324.1 hypothetical protein [Motilimonas sp. E26]
MDTKPSSSTPSKQIRIADGDTSSHVAVAYGTDLDTLLDFPAIERDMLVYAANTECVLIDAEILKRHPGAPIATIDVEVSPEKTKPVTVVPSVCNRPEIQDIIYVPRYKSWYLLEQELKTEVTEKICQLEVISQQLAELYSQPETATVDEIQAKQKAALNLLEQHKLLDQFKGGTYATFLSRPDKDKYLAYRMKLYFMSDIMHIYGYGVNTTKENWDTIKNLKLDAAGTKTIISPTHIAIIDKYFSQDNYLQLHFDSSIYTAFNDAIENLQQEIKALEAKAVSEAQKNYDLTYHQQNFVTTAQYEQFKVLSRVLRPSLRQELQYLIFLNQSHVTSDTGPANISLRKQLEAVQNKETNPKNILRNSLTIEALLLANQASAILPEQVLPIEKICGQFNTYPESWAEIKIIESCNWEALEQIISSADAKANPRQSTLTKVVQESGVLDLFDQPLDVTLSKISAYITQKAETPRVIFQINNWGLNHWSALIKRAETLVKKRANDFKAILSIPPTEQYLAAGLDALAIAYNEVTAIRQLAQTRADSNIYSAAGGNNQIQLVDGTYLANYLGKHPKLYWDISNFKFETPVVFTKLQGGNELIECFLMSRRTDASYITSVEWEKIKKSATKLQITPPIQNIGKATTIEHNKSENLLYRSSMSEFAKQFSKALDENLKWEFKGKKSNIEPFSERTGGIYHNWLYTNASGLVLFRTSAQAEFFRFSAGVSGKNALDKLVDGDIGEALKSLASCKASLTMDIAQGQIGGTFYIPHQYGFPLSLDYIDKQDQEKTALLGMVRLSASMSLYGWAGASVALSASLSILSGDGGMLMRGYNINKENAQFTFDAFAGVEAGLCTSGSLMWKPYKKENKASVLVMTPSEQQQLLSAEQQNDATVRAKIANKLLKNSKPAVTLDNGFVELCNLNQAVAINWGLGLKASFALGIVDGRLVAAFSARLVCGVGASGSLAAMINPSVLLDIVNAFSTLLSSEGFARLNVFAENDQDQGAYTYLNMAFTAALTNGIDVSKALLMRWDELLQLNKVQLCRENAFSIAAYISKAELALENEIWFENLLPEVKGRLFFVLLQSQRLEDKKKIKVRLPDLTANSRFKFPKRSRWSTLTDVQKEKAIRAAASDYWQRYAIAMLLDVWTNQTNHNRAGVPIERQIEESFTRFDINGEKPFPGLAPLNQLIPIGVWLKINSFFNIKHPIGDQEDDESKIFRLFRSDNQGEDIDYIHKALEQRDKAETKLNSAKDTFVPFFMKRFKKGAFTQTLLYQCAEMVDKTITDQFSNSNSAKDLLIDQINLAFEDKTAKQKTYYYYYLAERNISAEQAMVEWLAVVRHLDLSLDDLTQSTMVPLQPLTHSTPLMAPA